MSKFANRRSPSGPQSGLQLPYYNTSPTSGAVRYATIGAAGSVALEPGTEYRIPVPGRLNIPVVGRLDTLQISNQPVGADAVDVTYRARKNGASVGPALVIKNSDPGPVKIDLSSIAVVEGDLISIEINSTLAVLGGLAPVARILMTWVPGGAV